MPKKDPQGGRAAIAGFLYQIIASLNRSVQAAVSFDKAERSARLILEPESGGDLRSPKFVEQYKTRGSAKPWSPAEIVTEVLRDLVRAVPATEPPNGETYRFVTDGRCPLNQFRVFLSLIHGYPLPGDPLNALDNTDYRFSFRRRRYTARGLFGEIANTLKSDDPTGHLTWRLLSNFEINDGVSENSLLSKVDEVIRKIVDAHESAQDKRNALITVLLGFARQGRAFKPAELLNEVGLDIGRLATRAALPIEVKEQLRRDLDALGYVDQFDMRMNLPIPATDVVVFSGESGCGKSWALAQFARRESEAGRLVMLSRARSIADLKRQFIERLWNRAGFTTQTEIVGAARRLREDYLAVEQYHIVICIDDVQDMDFARDLFSADWGPDGIRLALSMQPRVARIAPPTQHVGTVPLHSFSVTELQRYLIARSTAWASIPSDMLRLLRRPILANLYCGLSRSGEWRPQNEYELMSRFWAERLREGMQADHPGDETLLRKLSEAIFDPQIDYPWSWTHAHALGLTEDVLRRLQVVGLIRRTDDSGPPAIEFTHDRILNWAVAESLVDRYLNRCLSIEQLYLLLERTQRIDLGRQAGGSLRRLGYVMMDVLWQLCGSQRARADACAELISLLAGQMSARYSDEGLFGELLPTLGVRVLASLERLIDTLDNSDEPPTIRARDLGRALRKIAEVDSGPVIASLSRRDLAKGSRDAVLHALAEVPAPEMLDQLWQLHLHNEGKAESATDNEKVKWYLATRESYNALRRSVSHDVSWLDRKIRSATAADRPDQLVYLLCDLPVLIGRPIWLAQKQKIFEITASNKSSIARAIKTFQDVDSLDWLIRELTDGQSKSPDRDVVFDALARLSPRLALENLRNQVDTHLFLTRGWWLPGLMIRAKEKTQQALLDLIDVGSWETAREVALIHSGFENFMSTMVLRSLVEALSRRLSSVEDAATWQPKGEGHILTAISRVSHPSLLKELSTYRGSEFEREIARFAQARFPHGEVLFEELQNILLKIAGPEFDRLVVSMIGSDADVAPDLALLTVSRDVEESLAERAVVIGSSTTSKWILALAVHDLQEPLAKAVLAGADVPWRGIDVRRDQTPLSENLVRDAVALLAPGTGEQRTRALLLLACSNRPDVGESLVRLIQSDATEDECRFALIALRCVRSFQKDWLPIILPTLNRGSARPQAMSYLIDCGDAHARSELADDIVKRNRTSDRTDIECASEILEKDECADVLRPYLHAAIADQSNFLYRAKLLCALSRSGDRSIDANLYELAEDTSSDSAAQSAVWGLLAMERFDPESAFEYVKRQFERRALPVHARLLLRTGHDKALEFILNRYGDQRTEVKWSIGRAIRKSNDETRVRDALKALSTSDSSANRAVAAELLGWIDGHLTDDLQRLSDDKIELVEKAALRAIQIRESRTIGAQLLEQMSTLAWTDQWTNLRAATELIDPKILADQDDALCFHRWVPHPPIFRIVTSQWLDERRDKMRRDAQDIDRRRGDS